MPTKPEWRRKKAREKATRLYHSVRNARVEEERIALLEELHAHVPEVLEAFCTKKQLSQLYVLGLPGPQGDLFREP